MQNLIPVIMALVLVSSACGNGVHPVDSMTGLADATEIDVASMIPGRVSELFVKEGDRVEKGQKLVLLEGDIIEAKVEQVNAAIDAAKAQLKMARKGTRPEEKRAVRRQVDAAGHQVDITKKMYDRLKALYDQKAIPKAKLDEVEFKFNVATEQLAMAEAKNDMVQKGARDEQLEALEALVNRAQGALAEVQSYNKETTQYAPISGVVSKIIVHEGELAATGYPILTVVNMDDIWAIFSIREDKLKNIQQGRIIHASIPALGKTVDWEVFNISALGDFATWKATSDKNSFDLKSFEVKARPVEPVDGLRPGMTVRWKLEN